MKRKHVTLTLEQKTDILNRLQAGQCVTSLAKHFGVGKSTVCDIKKNKQNILQFVASSYNGPGKRKTLKQSENPDAERCLYTWFLQERDRGTPLSGEIICEKAKFFYQRIANNNEFKASPGWLCKFKARYGIRKLTVSGEKMSCNVAAIEPFKAKLEEKIRELNLTRDQIYNADESGLFWRVLPNKTLAHRGEVSAPGQKISKDRITFMPCSNASGSHKLKLLVIGKSQKPRCFGNSWLPVSYKGQSKGWVTRPLFTDWFHSEFVPSVRQKMKELNLPPKALLVLDNAPGHPIELSSDDGQISVLYMPPNCTPLCQPMDQHVIQTVKVHYRKKLLKVIVESEGTIPEILKNWNLKNVVYALDEAWQRVTVALIQKSWNKLMKGPDDWDEEDDLPLAQLLHHRNPENEALSEVIELSRQLEPSLTNEEIEEWTVGSNENRTTLSDVDIIREILHASDDDEDKISSGEEDTSTRVKHNEVVSCINTCLIWASENNVPSHQQILLREIRGMAMKAGMDAQKQTKIQDFF